MSGPTQLPGFWAIVPAGGAGTRLWPLSRKGSPKFLHDLTGSGRTLLQQTWDRLTPLAPDRVVVVTGRVHAPEVARQLPGLPAAYLLAEPSPRDSMPAIAWAAAVIAANHVISAVEGFHAAVGEAVALARTGRLVTLGIAPTYAATGFGYIREGMPLGVEGAPSGRAVVEFVEKPDAERAAAYLASGEFRWNAGMFVVRASVLLELLEQWHPTMVEGVRALAADPERLDEVWPTLTKIAIDHAVAEPAAAAGRVAVVPATFGWDDIGDFDSLAGLLATDDGDASDDCDASVGGLSIVGESGDVLALDSTGLVVARSGRLVALIGVEDLVVVDTPDALLVVPRARAQEVKGIVDRLADLGREHLR